jgi:hypothetical protein
MECTFTSWESPYHQVLKPFGRISEMAREWFLLEEQNIRASKKGGTPE